MNSKKKTIFNTILFKNLIDYFLSPRLNHERNATKTLANEHNETTALNICEKFIVCSAIFHCSSFS